MWYSSSCFITTLILLSHYRCKRTGEDYQRTPASILAGLLPSPSLQVEDLYECMHISGTGLYGGLSHGRLQSVLLDQLHMIVVDHKTVNSRGKIEKQQPGDAHLGDCIDCFHAQKYAPPELMIRNGTQMEMRGLHRL